MSFHHDNIVWKESDGSYSIGFFTRIEGYNSSDEDYDPEWDDSFDYGSFEWASTGHRTADDAMDAWSGANPGSYDVDESQQNLDSYKVLIDRYRRELAIDRHPAGRFA